MLRTVAPKGEGIDELVAALDRHFGYLEASGTARRGAVGAVARACRGRRQDASSHHGSGATPARATWLDEQLPALEVGATNPFAVADALLARSGNLLTRMDR